MTRDEIRGRWDIVSWKQVYEDGRVTYPLGERLTGFIVYGDHEMFLVIEKADRPPFTSGGQWNAAADEKAGAYDSYFTYAGGYELEGDTISHKIVHSLYPNWEGGTQRREAHFVNGVLKLVARLEQGTSEARTATLEWRRNSER